MSFRILILACALSAGACVAALAQSHSHGAPSGDSREFVPLPEPMGSHMLSNMRDHLVALEEIQRALAGGDMVLASSIAEKRLGMSSLDSHGASHIAQFMPSGMRDAGTAMHRAASRFAIAAQDAGVSGDLKAPLSALADVTRACTGCHAGYRTR